MSALNFLQPQESNTSNRAIPTTEYFMLVQTEDLEKPIAMPNQKIENDDLYTLLQANVNAPQWDNSILFMPKDKDNTFPNQEYLDPSTSEHYPNLWNE